MVYYNPDNPLYNIIYNWVVTYIYPPYTLNNPGFSHCSNDEYFPPKALDIQTPAEKGVIHLDAKYIYIKCQTSGGIRLDV